MGNQVLHQNPAAVLDLTRMQRYRPPTMLDWWYFDKTAWVQALVREEDPTCHS